MAEPQDTQPDTPASSLDARIEALEQYLATQPVQAPTAQTQASGALPKSIDFAGGTIIHIPHVGSFHITSDTASRAGFIAVAGLLVFGVLVFFLRHRHARHEPQ
jgi:hypothetical protein